MSDPIKKTEDQTILTEGHQPLQKGHTAVDISNIGENPPTGGSGLANTSTAENSLSSTSETNDSGSNTTISNSESGKD
jgi:hypothetical protein